MPQLKTRIMDEDGVRRALETGLEQGRRQVARIVGRDTASLSREEILRATIETVAENATDGVLSPMLFFALGGPVAAMVTSLPGRSSRARPASVSVGTAAPP